MELIALSLIGALLVLLGHLVTCVGSLRRYLGLHPLMSLLAVHRHARGSVYADPDLLAANAQDCKGDVVTDPERLVQSSR